MWCVLDGFVIFQYKEDRHWCHIHFSHHNGLICSSSMTVCLHSLGILSTSSFAIKKPV